jgi:choline kinase
MNFINYILKPSIDERLLMMRGDIHFPPDFRRRIIQAPLELGIKARFQEAIVIG